MIKQQQIDSALTLLTDKKLTVKISNQDLLNLAKKHKVTNYQFVRKAMVILKYMLENNYLVLEHATPIHARRLVEVTKQVAAEYYNRNTQKKSPVAINLDQQLVDLKKEYIREKERQINLLKISIKRLKQENDLMEKLNSLG